MRKALALVSLAILAAAGLVMPGSSGGHAERESTWPTYPGSVPKKHRGGPTEVVCKDHSRRRIEKLPQRYRRSNRRLLEQCRFHDIQAAVDAAENGTRILLLPGVYKEKPSRSKPLDDPKCASMKTEAADGTSVPNYDYERNCPNSRNLIALIGDSNGDRRCDDKCNIEISGTARAQDVLIYGDRRKLNVIKADRADGVYLSRFTIQYSDFNNIYVLETNGFHFNHIVSRWSREYGFLSFTSEAGLYENLEGYGNGDSAVYPGSGAQGLESERNCETYGIEIRNVEAYGNNMAYSGTAGDSVWAHDNNFHDNATGMVTDSFAAGHPGMPQHCAKWERNRVYSNNFNIFAPERRETCRKPPEQRSPKFVCSAFQVPVGTGILIPGGNRNIVRDNYIWDNWRQGAGLFWVPAFARGEGDPSKQYDTSNGNRFEDNHMGVTPDGKRAPNGVDFWWDEEGQGNCWSGNRGPGGAAVTSDPATLPGCPEGNPFSTGNTSKLAQQAPCAVWNPKDDPPPGCNWAETPPKPR